MTLAWRAHGKQFVVIGSMMVAMSVLMSPMVAGASPSVVTCSTTAAISLDPTLGTGGTSVAVAGTGYCPDTSVVIHFRDHAGVKTDLTGDTPVGADGTFSATIVIPSDAALNRGKVRATDAQSWQCPFAAFQVTAPG
jgi:hypothetical protein